MRLDSSEYIGEAAQMEWYWWIIIVIGVGALGYFKLKIWDIIKKNRKKKSDQEEEQ